MSSLIIEKRIVDEVRTHPNADALDIITLQGWQLVVRKDSLKRGDSVLYVPPDAVLPKELSDKLGVTQHLSKGRVRCARLRGEMSYGLTIPDEFIAHVTDGKYAEALGITKYEPPPVDDMSGMLHARVPNFIEYTDIENYRNFPTLLQEGEEVVITEKIHGTNFRAGWVEDEWLVGSHRQNLLENDNNLYWRASRMYPLREMISPYAIPRLCNNIMIFGEIYGPGINKFRYGLKDKHIMFFDISVNQRYNNYDSFKQFCDRFNWPTVPVLYRGPWNTDLLKLAEGKSTLTEDNVREGIVIKPVTERYDVTNKRVCLKYFNPAYELKD